MSELIDRQAFIENERKLYCEDCDRRKGTKNGKPNVICYEIGEAPCRACWLDDALTDLEDFPAASPWHRVEDGLPEMSEIVPGYVCSETLVLYDAKSGHIDIGYVREKPDGVDWLCGEPFKNPTHWMSIEPQKEENDGN